LQSRNHGKKMKRLTHISSDGRAQMVNVSAKPLSKRRAIACGKIRLQRETLDLIAKDQIAKGNVLATARIAGIQAAKQTAQLIPLCHTLPLSEVNIDIVTRNDGAEVKCTAQTIAQTGVEMEALVGVTVSLLTIYDMCKAADKTMEISCVRLIEKTTGTVAAVSERRSKKSRHS
jgi:cyclic pyranopterin monophosphate synthase